jgi:hypothetical protein
MQTVESLFQSFFLVVPFHPLFDSFSFVFLGGDAVINRLSLDGDRSSTFHCSLCDLLLPFWLGLWQSTSGVFPFEKSERLASQNT